MEKPIEKPVDKPVDKIVDKPRERVVGKYTLGEAWLDHPWIAAKPDLKGRIFHCAADCKAPVYSMITEGEGEARKVYTKKEGDVAMNIYGPVKGQFWVLDDARDITTVPEVKQAIQSLGPDGTVVTAEPAWPAGHVEPPSLAPLEHHGRVGEERHTKYGH